MHSNDKLSGVASLICGVLLSPGLRAQNTTCQPNWDPGFEASPGVGDQVRALHVFDDGSGAALYVGGFFTSAGGAPASRVAKWDGENWAALGSGTDNAVLALTSFDDGSGPALYAAGIFSTAGGTTARSIAKWDGQSWSPLGAGLNGGVTSMAVYDDGSGAALYVGGSFTTAGGVLASRIAKWSGQSWSAVGVGLGAPVEALTVFDSGSHSVLCAASEFAVRQWDGQAWTTLGGAFDVAPMSALATFDDGAGPALYAAGAFTQIGGVSANRVAKWTGTTWAPLDSGLSARARALAVFDDGSGGGPSLYASGEFTSAGGVSAQRIARWNGQSWAALGTGVSGSPFTIVAPYAMATFDDGDGGGPSLFVGGNFTHAGSQVVNYLAKWRASGWSVTHASLNGAVRALATLELAGSSGPALYAGGEFTAAGSVGLSRIARREGNGWTPLGAGMDGSVEALASFDDGGGPALYAGGYFTSAGGVSASRIAKWDGQSWSALGAGLDGGVLALAVYDDGGGAGPVLVVGGSFSLAGGQPAARVATWNGQNWAPLGFGLSGGVSFGPPPYVRALTVFDDGFSGPALFAGGHFTTSAGTPLTHLARWNGQFWSDVGGGPAIGSSSGLVNYVAALSADDGALGGGPALFVGGRFASVGSVSANNVARWDGLTWSALGGGASGDVNALERLDDGGVAGPSLFVGGNFFEAGGVSAPTIARWNGASWSSLATAGAIFSVEALAAQEDGLGSPPALFVGGGFTGNAGPFLAKWQGCSSLGAWLAYCTAGTTSNGCVPTISAAGSPSVSAASGFSIDVAQLEGQKQGLIYYGVSGRASAPWGVGSTSFQCVKAPVQRMGVQSSGGTAAQCDGTLSVDWLAQLAASGGGLGSPFSAGELVNAQAWFRDPPAPRSTNLSDALEFVLSP